MNRIKIQVIANDVNGTSALSMIIKNPSYEANIFLDASRVEEDAILLLGCPPDQVRYFGWTHKKTIAMDAIRIANSGIVPEGCPTRAFILINHGGCWKNLGDHVEEAIRAYLRYSVTDVADRLPWGGFNPKNQDAKAWIQWWNTIPHNWDLTPLTRYEERRRESERLQGGLRETVSEFHPRLSW